MKTTIRGRIIRAVLAMQLVAMVLLGTATALLNYDSTNTVLRDAMLETAKITADRIRWEIESYEDIAMEVGAIAELSDSGISTEQKKAIIDQRVKQYGFQRGNILDANGISIFDGNNYSDREYFQHSMHGEAHISDPISSKVTNELTFIISAPLWKDGVPDSEVVGVVFFVPDGEFLNNIMKSLYVSENSTAYMINQDGYVVADVTNETVLSQKNIEEEAKTDKSLEKLASIHADMRAGNTGFKSYRAESNKYLAYAPVPGTEGWSIAININKSDFMTMTDMSLVITFIWIVVAMFISAAVAAWVGKRISEPVRICAERINKLAEGDLHSEVIMVHTKDETKLLAKATQKIVDDMTVLITDLGKGLEALAAGNLTAESQTDFPGDFEILKLNLQKAFVDLNVTLKQINEAAGQVSSGAEQVSAGAQTLSQGTTEQASSIQELSATINDISKNVAESAEDLKNANNLIMENGDEVSNCDNHMHDMIKAMNEISEASTQINKIIKTIDDIAFQTNILALNAAVEAARAGDAGRGFAVVAEEVRNLAQKSAEAAQNTTKLIQDSIRAVDNGTEIADDTAKSLAKIVSNSEVIGNVIDKIANASNEQASAAVQVSQGVEQISGVVQANAATAEESAATSEELSGQSDMLRSLVAKFQLKDMDAAQVSKASVFAETSKDVAGGTFIKAEAVQNEDMGDKY